MLSKAWPKELTGDCQLNDTEQYGILLINILTWAPWPGFLKFFGMKSNVIFLESASHVL